MADPTREQLLDIVQKGSIDIDGSQYRLVDYVYEAKTESEQELEWHRLGDPATNCTPGTTQPIELRIGGSRTDTETWSVGGSVGIDLEVVKVEGKAEYQRSHSVEHSEHTTVKIPTGKKNSLTLGRGWVTQTGRLRVVVAHGGSTSFSPVAPGTLPVNEPIQETTFYVDDVTRRVPTDYKEIGQNEVGCDSKFTVDPEP